MTVYETTELDDSISSASDSTEVSVIPVQENNQPQEEDSNSPYSSLTELSYDSTRIANRPVPIQPVEPAPIQPVEPVIGLTTEEQYRREEDPSLTQNELLGLPSCEDYISTPLKTLDGLYVNQPSRFLPWAEEAKKLAKKIKAEEEASQWSGIPVEQLLNNSFTEQLNCIQSLQQIAPLHAAKDHLSKNIITILERLGKVDNMPFDKLYYLAENNCASKYGQSLKVFRGFWPVAVTVVYGFGKVSSSSGQFRESAVSVWFSETSHFQEYGAFTASNDCSSNIYCEFVYLH